MEVSTEAKVKERDFDVFSRSDRVELTQLQLLTTALRLN